MTSTSPLRYPGGKARFTTFIQESIIASGEEIRLFVEPFCGGAGAAIALLDSESVDSIALNDADPLVASFWKIVFGKSCRSRRDIDWLIRKVENTIISIDEWKIQKALQPTNTREAAWKCLFLNRTSFNGILHKSGPIGGWEQINRTLDVRFNRERLVTRLRELFALRDSVERVDCMGWQRFCTRYRNEDDAYLYLDPPYYHRAEQLYKYLFNERMHRSMRDYLVDLQIPWLLSYDDAPEVRALYTNRDGIDGRVIDQTYSTHPVGGASFIGRELVFSNRELPLMELEAPAQPHVGITIVGALHNVAHNGVGPIRTPIAQLTIQF